MDLFSIILSSLGSFSLYSYSPPGFFTVLFFLWTILYFPYTIYILSEYSPLLRRKYSHIDSLARFLWFHALSGEDPKGTPYRGVKLKNGPYFAIRPEITTKNTLIGKSPWTSQPRGDWWDKNVYPGTKIVNGCERCNGYVGDFLLLLEYFPIFP